MIVRWFGLILFMCWTSAAQAGVSVPASGCVPNLATIRDNRALVGNASVQHAGDNVDPIVLTCTIPPFDTNHGDWTIRITYVDSNGPTANAFVQARLFRMNLGSQTPVLVASVNSNNDIATGLNELGSGVFQQNFNFQTRTYWFHIDIERANASQTVILHSVALSEVFFSDIRAKHNIALLGQLDNGLGLYRFSYNGSDKAYVGVMAQEVEAIRPDAVVRGSDGYLRVNYSRLGLSMQSFEDWMAAGGKIPSTNTQ